MEDLIYNHGLGDSCGVTKSIVEPVKPVEPEQPSTLPTKPVEPEQPSTLPTKPVEPVQPSTLLPDGSEESETIERATGQDQCKAGFTFNQEACACFSDRQTLIFCFAPTINNPITGVGCIGEAEQDRIF